MEFPANPVFFYLHIILLQEVQMNPNRCLNTRSILAIHKHLSRFFLCKFFFSLIILISASVPGYALAEKDSLINCDIQNSACTQTLEGIEVTLDVMPKPVKAMTDLIFNVVISGDYSGKAPYIDLNMPAMDMGPNRVMLKDLGQGVFEGRGVIVRCRSGRKTWRARVILPDLGRADFIFDVVY